LPSAANCDCWAQVVGSKCDTLASDASKIVFTSSALVFASLAKVVIPAAAKTSAATGPTPSISVKSSADLGAFGAFGLSDFAAAFFLFLKLKCSQQQFV